MALPNLALLNLVAAKKDSRDSPARFAAVILPLRQQFFRL
jgi:hypothetical protein